MLGYQKILTASPLSLAVWQPPKAITALWIRFGNSHQLYSKKRTWTNICKTSINGSTVGQMSTQIQQLFRLKATQRSLKWSIHEWNWTIILNRNMSSIPLTTRRKCRADGKDGTVGETETTVDVIVTLLNSKTMTFSVNQTTTLKMWAGIQSTWHLEAQGSLITPIRIQTDT